ncbi:Amino-acid acetyltransferase [Halomonadaceae bacterium LMG 33818]|uniref:amino-acid N-acetyltransferase n=1 Tax=Cernens ardua TaxID=3402176 RepID=UPI003EDC2FA2
MEESFDFAAWFRGSAPYIDKHRDKTFVVLIEGDALHGGGIDLLVQDIALLHTLGVRPVLVYGVREAEFQQALCHNSRDADAREAIDRRIQHAVVDGEAMKLLEAEANHMRTVLESRFSVGLPNTPMHGLDIVTISGNLVMAKPFGIRNGIDFSHVGEVRGVRTQAIKQLLDQNMVVLIPPLGHSSTGELFYIDPADVACSVAVQLKAEKLILLGRDEGLKTPEGHLIRELGPRDAEQIPPQEITSPELARHLAAACSAAQQGVARTHLLSWHDRNALLNELFTRDGVGTMISSERYEQLRGARLSDVAGLLELMRPLEEKGILIHRSRERLEEQIHDYRVIVKDGMTIGCAALHPYDAEAKGELACLVVHPDYRGSTLGERLLGSVEEEARQRGITALFALTTHTSHWFLEHGFAEGNVDDLPPRRFANYNVERNSKILLKHLSPSS